MWQAFVPASGSDNVNGAGRSGGSKKRRRVRPGDGEMVSLMYKEIVGPGGIDNNNNNNNNNNGSRRDMFAEEHNQADRSTTDRPPAAATSSSSSPPPPQPPLRTSRHGGVEDTEPREMPGAENIVFGPPPNPNAAAAVAAAAVTRRAETSREEEEEVQEEGFFCRVCGERVTSVPREKHDTSTLHIFNQQHRPADRKVQIHESNKGFQLLANMGWKLDEGLGARKQGRVNPLQTTFKRDTAGLGAGSGGEKPRPRVTHFPSHIPSQALNAPDGKSDAIRAHEDLDRTRRAGLRGRRRVSSNGNSRGGFGGGGGGGGGDDRFVVSRESNSSRGVVVDAMEQPNGGVSDGSGGGFWGQGTHSGNVCGSGSSSSGRGGGNSVATGERGRSKAPGGRSGSGSGYFMSRKDRAVKEEGERRKERRRKFELFSDVPEEFAALFTG